MVGTAGGNDPDTGDIYLGWDRFGRVKDNYWYDYGSTTDVDRIKYGYDRAGNRIWRENTVAASYGKHFDELYAYDLIHRLKHMDRGDLNALKDAVTNLQFAQCWKLDETGNWSNFREDDDGDSSWDLVQNRTNNKVNEITNVTKTTGPSWVTPAYSKAGNMTTVPKPADPTVGFTCTYDAWNRLVKIEEGDDTVAEYEYDGAKRRVVKRTYSGGILDETRHLYYTEPPSWQVTEERVDASSDPDRQFVWGLRYIDDIVLRDRDTTADGSLDERLFGLQDGNWNLVVIADATGSVQERYRYNVYGALTVLTSAFIVRASSQYDWGIRFAGYPWESDSELYQARNRHYHAVVGVWLQRDPLGLSSGPNLYDYAKHSPLLRTDPSGKLTPVGGCLVGGVVSGVVSVVVSLGQGQGVGESLWDGVCAGVGGCIAGAIVGAAPSPLVSCLAGALGGAVTELCDEFGDAVAGKWACDTFQFELDWSEVLCSVLTGMGTSCVAGLGVGDDAVDAIEFVVQGLGLGMAAFNEVCQGAVDVFG